MSGTTPQWGGSPGRELAARCTGSGWNYLSLTYSQKVRNNAVIFIFEVPNDISRYFAAIPALNVLYP